MKQYISGLFVVLLLSGCSWNWNFWSQKTPEVKPVETKQEQPEVKKSSSWWSFGSQKAPATPEKSVQQEKKVPIPEAKISLASIVLMYDLDVTDRPYVSLGEVSASVTKLNPWGDEPTQDAVVQKLKEEALKKGADALIFVRYTKLGASWNRVDGLEGKAQAVKFTRY